MKRIFILDAVNFLFRSYYAISPMTNSKGESTHALFGFIRSLEKIISDFSPDYIVAVFDGPNNKKTRTELYKDYKSHRKEMPEDLFCQWKKAVEFCQLSGIAQLSIEGVEADDVIGSLAKWAKKNSMESYICTSDKDLCQLVTKSSFVVHAHKNNLLVTEEKVEELFGVQPSQIVDYLALVGDASDNIPGVEGIGPKSAQSLLKTYGSLSALLSHRAEIKGKKAELLEKGKDNAELSYKLALLDLEVPIPEEVEFYQKKPAVENELQTFFQDNHFLSLMKEKPVPTKKVETSYKIIESDEELSPLLSHLLKQKSLCFDTETTKLNPLEASLVGIGVGFKEGQAWYIPFNQNLSKKALHQFFSALFSSSNTTFFGHNIKYDLHVLSNEKLPLPHIDFDTILASYLLTPNQSRHSLDALCLEKFQFTKTPISDLIGKGKKQIPMNQVDPVKVGLYCCEDVDYTVRLKTLFDKQIEKKNLSSVLQDIELPLIPILLQMERSGMFVDAKKLSELSKILTEKIDNLTKSIHDVAGESFNISSPKQLQAILFDKLGLKPPKKTQTGYSTAADVLEILKDKSPIIPLIIEYRQLEKLRSTYVDSLPHEINPFTGRIHCSFNQSVAATGRLSCQNPNLQNIPIRSDIGKEIRKAFKPEKENWYYVSADYSQIELRLLAHLSQDPALIEAFNAGEDIHTFTASLIFDTPIDAVSSEMRYRAKAVNFGIIYGQQAFGLAKELSIDIKQASKFIETYFERYKGVNNYLDSCKDEAREKGLAMTMTGRQRQLLEISSKNPILRSAAERLAINTPLQGSAADLIKLAMIQIQRNWIFKKSFLVLQIHDELIFEVAPDELEDLKAYVKKHMESVFSLRIPLLVDISVGKNWGEC